MITNWLARGDTHAQFAWVYNDYLYNYKPEETAIIILGDAGFNFYLNKNDDRRKAEVNSCGYRFYCVRGNHEERPENIETMEQWYDYEIDGTVWRESEYPNIRYLMDGHAYLIDKKPTLVIGGAYSVDKYYRLSHFSPDAEWTGWFKDEQLTKDEMNSITERFNSKHFTLVLSHTCPASWQPFDLFLSGLDQSTVDKTMENWLETFKDKIDWDIWLFGHFHDDRLVRPGVEMYYNDIEDLQDVIMRWTGEGRLDWWLKKDPNYDLSV